MEWKLVDQSQVAGTQNIYQGEPVLVGDSVQTKTRLFESYGSNVEEAGKIYAWSLFLSNLLAEWPTEYSALLQDSLKACFAADITPICCGERTVVTFFINFG